jgi:hypothetical protein
LDPLRGEDERFLTKDEVRKKLEATPGVDTTPRLERVKRTSSTQSMVSHTGSRSPDGGGSSGRRSGSVSPAHSVRSDTSLRPPRKRSVTPPADKECVAGVHKPEEAGISAAGHTEPELWAAKVGAGPAVETQKDGVQASKGKKRGETAKEAAVSGPPKGAATAAGAGNADADGSKPDRSTEKPSAARSKASGARFAGSTASSRRRHSADAGAPDASLKAGLAQIVAASGSPADPSCETTTGSAPLSQTLRASNANASERMPGQTKQDPEVPAVPSRLLSSTISSRQRAQVLSDKQNADTAGAAPLLGQVTVVSMPEGDNNPNATSTSGPAKATVVEKSAPAPLGARSDRQSAVTNILLRCDFPPAKPT